MDYSLIIVRLGTLIRKQRRNQGLTQARQKIIAIEKGDLTVGISAYVRAVGALDCEFALMPAVMPTLDEIQGIFD